MPIRLVLIPAVGAVRGSGSGRLLFLTVRRLGQVAIHAASLTRAVVVLASHSRIERMRVALARAISWGLGSGLSGPLFSIEVSLLVCSMRWDAGST
jgi:hypothetical protein